MSAMSPYANTRGVITGGRDGCVKTWDASLKLVGEALDLSRNSSGRGGGGGGGGADSLNPAIISVHGGGERMWQH